MARALICACELPCFLVLKVRSHEHEIFRRAEGQTSYERPEIAGVLPVNKDFLKKRVHFFSGNPAEN